MFFSFSFGFLFGVFTIIALEGFVLLSAIKWLQRKAKTASPPSDDKPRDLDGEQSLAFAYNKKGIVWVLEPGEIPKLTKESPTKGPKELKNKKGIADVHPVKKYARIKDRSLILSDPDGSQATIKLLGCTIVAVSASDMSSRKWAKRYPIRLESKSSIVYNGSKTCYLYLETSWEKEAWCKALRLASSPDKEKLNWFSHLSEEFHHYLLSLSAEYPSFLKPPAVFDEATDKINRIDESSSRVRHFLKRLGKKTSKSGVESKTSSVSSSTRGEKKTWDKIRPLLDVSSTDGSIKGSSEEKSSANSLHDMMRTESPTISKSLLSVVPNSVCSEKTSSDEGTLCWNLLFSRLFFDAKKSSELNSAIKVRIQRTLSNMRTPSYIGAVTCTGLDLGSLPPFIHKLRVLPMDLNEVWSLEADIEYLGGIVLDVETRIEACEPELENDIIETSFIPTSAGEETSDLLKGIIEDYGEFRDTSNSVDRMDSGDQGDNVDGLKQSKSTRWSSNYVSKWKAAMHSIASQVSQVPISLAIRIASLRGTLRLHIKPPPSDQLWFGFTSMPEIEWNLDSSVGDRRITSSHIALLIGNRFKAAIRDSLVLPNCESVCIPWMLSEKDDWIPRQVAPFIWVNQEAMDTTGLDSTSSLPEEIKMKLDSSNGTEAGAIAYTENKVEKMKYVVSEPLPQEASSESVTSQSIPFRSLSSNQPLGGSIPIPSRSFSTNQPLSRGTSEELREPLLRIDETQDRHIRLESPKTSSSSDEVVLVDQASIPLEDHTKQPKKMNSRRTRMLDLGKKMGEKLEEKRRHIEEKSRQYVERMRENTKA